MNRRMKHRPSLRAAVCGWLLLIAPVALAGNAALEEALVNYLKAQTAHVRGDVEIELTMPDVALAACRSPQPFLPGRSARLSGRVTVGVKCPGDRPPTRYFQAYISIIAPYFVAAKTIEPGAVISADDIERVTGDITRLSPSITKRPAALLGMVATRRVAEGMPLADSMFRPVIAIKRGDRVRVVADGAGFSITTSGKALNNAGIGDEVRVRTDSGATVTGVSRDASTVVVRP